MQICCIMFFLYSFWVIAKEFDIGNYILFIYYGNNIAIIIVICLFVYSQYMCNYENNFIANGPMVVVLIFWHVCIFMEMIYKISLSLICLYNFLLGTGTLCPRFDNV